MRFNKEGKLKKKSKKEFTESYKVNWMDVSKYNLLSEDFIREFKDHVNWEYISIN